MKPFNNTEDYEGYLQSRASRESYFGPDMSPRQKAIPDLLRHMTSSNPQELPLGFHWEKRKFVLDFNTTSSSLGVKVKSYSIQREHE